MTSLPPPSFESKVCPLDQIATRIAKLPRPLVFTNGVFDILHRGHASYLAQARALGASLVVGVNSDASVKMLDKGDDRPINSEADRQALLAALERVDMAVLFIEQTPVNLIEKIRPDIYVKGGDYRPETLDSRERAVLTAVGAKVRILPFVKGFSTTRLIGRIRRAGC